MFFKKKKSKVSKETIDTKLVEFPICVELYDDKDDITYIFGSDINKYWFDNNKDVIIYDFDASKVWEYSSLKDKINIMRLYILDNGLANIEIEFNTILNSIEEEYLLEFIKGQMSDGWGEGILDDTLDDGTNFNISFWNNKDWYIKYIK